MDIVLTHHSALECLRAYSLASPVSHAEHYSAAELARPMEAADTELTNCAVSLYELDTFGLTRLRRERFGFAIQGWGDLTNLNGRYYPLPLSEPLSVLVPMLGTNRASEAYVRRTWTQELPQGSLWLMGKAVTFCSPPLDAWLQGGNVLVSSPELCFYQRASELSRERLGKATPASKRPAEKRRALIELVLLGMELCGRYVCNDAGRAVAYERMPLTCVKRLAELGGRLPHAHRTKLAADALRYVADGSRSPAETASFLLLCMPRKLGGYALAKPSEGHELPEALRGAEAERALSSVSATHELAKQVARELGTRVRTADREFTARRAELRRLVLPPETSPRA